MINEWSNGCRQKISEHTARSFRTGDASGPRRVLGKWNSQARCPILHLASASSFSDCVHARFAISASRSAKFSRSKVRNNLAERNHFFTRDRLKAISNGLPCFTTSHERQDAYFCWHVMQWKRLTALLPRCQVSSVRAREQSASLLFSE